MDKKQIKVFIVHGLGGDPNGGWRPYLMGELAMLDVYACSLSMPNPVHPVLSDWLHEIHRLIDRNQNDDIYLVGHSLGGAAVLRFVEQYNFPNIKGLVMVSAPATPVDRSDVDSFLEGGFDFALIKSRVPNIAVIHGTDDPVVSFADAEFIAAQTGGQLIPVDGGKHLNGSAGFRSLPECLTVLKNFFNLS